MRFFTKPKTQEEIKEEIQNKEQLNRAYRLSTEMRALAENLLEKVDQLERELQHGG